MSLPAHVIDLHRDDARNIDQNVCSLTLSPCGRYLAVGTNEVDSRVLILSSSSPTHETLAQTTLFALSGGVSGSARVAWSSDSSTLIASNAPKEETLFVFKVDVDEAAAVFAQQRHQQSTGLQRVPAKWPAQVASPHFVAISGCSQYVCTSSWTNDYYHLTVSRVEPPSMLVRREDADDSFSRAGSDEQQQQRTTGGAKTVASFMFGPANSLVLKVQFVARQLFVLCRCNVFLLDYMRAGARLAELDRSPEGNERGGEIGKPNDKVYAESEDEDDVLRCCAVRKLTTPFSLLRAAAVSNDGMRIAVSGRLNNPATPGRGFTGLVMLDTVFGIPIEPLSSTLTKHTKALFPVPSSIAQIVAVAFSPLGTKLAVTTAVVSGAGKVFVFDANTGALLDAGSSGSGEIRSVAFLSETEYAIGTSAGRIHFYKMVEMMF